MKIKEVINFFEKTYPVELASDFDRERIGLIVGDNELELTRILLSLDLNIEVLNEAINEKANLIVLHHNPFFNGMKKFLFQSYDVELLKQLFIHKISVYVMHTNLDVGKSGVNDTLASMLSIKNFNIIPAKDNFIRCGEIDEITLEALTSKVKNIFNLNGVRYVGDLNRMIKTVGIIGGSGGREEDVHQAFMLGLDCYITGEIKLSAAQRASYQNLSLIEVNHGVERFVMESLSKLLIEDLNLLNRVCVSKVQTDPLISI